MSEQDDLKKGIAQAIANHLADCNRIATLEMLSSACVDENSILLAENRELESENNKLRDILKAAKNAIEDFVGEWQIVDADDHLMVFKQVLDAIRELPEIAGEVSDADQN